MYKYATELPPERREREEEAMKEEKNVGGKTKFGVTPKKEKTKTTRKRINKKIT
jgi:hypothetical protein